MDRNTIAKRLTGPVLLALGAIALISFGDAPARAGGNTFTVNSDLDPGDGVCDGTCTLRDAIIFANASPGHDSIVFNPNTVPDAIYVIELSSLLPSIDGSQGITVSLPDRPWRKMVAGFSLEAARAWVPRTFI
jgi:CSLREA domain-containing protein